ncbi:MAG: 4-hydroxy-3-methylbut-2-enyl diphosphate reductase [Desulfuromonas sp.]|nr:MAG: 4-hydroxy-3-methylbut-2-enyl diphosphate reductase [Desulfuromonas sp.]
MKIVVAKSAGFCFGVKRATQMAFDAAENHSKICSLGPIIHSPQLVKKLEDGGVRVVKTPAEIGEGAVIVRSHGVTADEIAVIEALELEIIDATCPFVKNAQKHANSLSANGYHLILVGESDHPEVQGIVSYATDGPVTVVATPEDAERLPKAARYGIVAQTTQSFDNLQDIVTVCLRKAKEVRVFNTICDATAVRQDEARAIAMEADVVLVIGGFNSANTTRLASICRDIQPETHHVETADDIEPGWLACSRTVGVTAGASTPAWLIEQVILRLQQITSQQ